MSQPPTGQRPGTGAAATAEPAQDPVLAKVSGVTRTFGTGAAAVHALRGVSLTIERGQLVALSGRSGSGKTTLLNIIGGLDRPDTGSVRIDGRDIAAMGERERTLMRRSSVAFIFQSLGSSRSCPRPRTSASRCASPAPNRRTGTTGYGPCSTSSGLAEHARQRPGELSGGQQQRVAIARALAGRPQLLIADEPTGQLDSETGRQIMRLIRSVVRTEGVTALVATHDPAFLDIADVSLRLEDGQIAA